MGNRPKAASSRNGRKRSKSGGYWGKAGRKGFGYEPGLDGAMKPTRDLMGSELFTEVVLKSWNGRGGHPRQKMNRAYGIRGLFFYVSVCPFLTPLFLFLPSFLPLCCLELCVGGVIEGSGGVTSLGLYVAR